MRLTAQIPTSFHGAQSFKWALINTAIDGRAACCYAAYYRPRNQLYLCLDNGDGSQAANMVLTGNNTISNSQCSVATSPITFSTTFGGLKGVWLAGPTMGGVQTSPRQALGAWAVPFNLP